MDTIESLTKDAKSKLDKVVDINKDASEFYSTAKDKVESEELRATFIRFADMHKNILQKVDAILKRADGSRDADEASETVVGASSRIFAELMANISSNPDRTLVNRLEAAEDRCLHSLQEALEDSSLGVNTRHVLEQELTKTRQTHDYMREIKDKMAA